MAWIIFMRYLLGELLWSSTLLSGDDEVVPVADESSVNSSVGLLSQTDEVGTQGGASGFVEPPGRDVGGAVMGEEEVGEVLG
jgi:hypothetical protein